jgi:hypothetical protein
MVAALLQRVLVSTIEEGFRSGTLHDPSMWLSGTVAGYRVLATQAVPMLLVVVATANLAPRHGWMRRRSADHRRRRIDRHRRHLATRLGPATGASHSTC